MMDLYWFDSADLPFGAAASADDDATGDGRDGVKAVHTAGVRRRGSSLMVW